MIFWLRNLGYITLGLFVFSSISSTYNQKQKENSFVDSAWVQIFKLSLVQKYKYLNNPSNYRHWLPNDVYVLDSNIVKSDLPKLQVGRLIPISLDAINKKAKLKDVSYINLALLQINSDTAKVIWREVEAIYSKKYKMVEHLVGEIEMSEYHIISKGWVGGLMRIEYHAFSHPK